jgi:hypothetical protein
VADDSGAPRQTFTYRADVVEHLWRHGVHPAPWTPPELVRDFVRDLYKYEIRALRARMLRSEFPRAEYAGLVDDLRRRYTVLSLLPRQFLTERQTAAGETAEDTMARP